MDNEILLKAMVQAISTFSMSVFWLPSKLFKDISAIMSKFWWEHRNDNKKNHWKNWKPLEVSKERGGLGFRHIDNVNNT